MNKPKQDPNDQHLSERELLSQLKHRFGIVPVKVNEAMQFKIDSLECEKQILFEKLAESEKENVQFRRVLKSKSEH